MSLSMMPKDIVLQKIPYHVIDRFNNTFTGLERQHKTKIERFEIHESGNTLKITGYDLRGRSYSFCDVLIKTPTGVIDEQVEKGLGYNTREAFSRVRPGGGSEET